MRSEAELDSMLTQVERAFKELGDSAPQVLLAVWETLRWTRHESTPDRVVTSWIPPTLPRVTSEQIDKAIRPACLVLDMTAGIGVTHSSMRSVIITAFKAAGFEIEDRYEA